MVATVSPKGAAWSSKLAWKPPAVRRIRISSLPLVIAVKSLAEAGRDAQRQRRRDVGDRLADAHGVARRSRAAPSKLSRTAQVAPTTGAPCSVSSETLAVPSSAGLVGIDHEQVRPA